MKTRINFYLSSSIVVAMILLSIASCKKKEEEPGLDGKWQSDNGTGVLVKGSSGTFYSIGGFWISARDQGFVKLGDLKFKEITKEGPVKWSLYELGYHYSGATVVDIFWSEKGSLTMSEDGQSIKTSYPISGLSVTYYRK